MDPMGLNLFSPLPTSRPWERCGNGSFARIISASARRSAERRSADKASLREFLLRRSNRWWLTLPEANILLMEFHPVEVGSLYHYDPLCLHPGWCRIFSSFNVVRVPLSAIKVFFGAFRWWMVSFSDGSWNATCHFQSIPFMDISWVVPPHEGL